SQEGFFLRHQQDGIWIPVNLSITRLHIEPKPLGLITARDIREQREAHRRLKAAEERLRAVVNHAPVILFALDQHGIFTLSEGKGLESLRGQPGEVVGQSVFNVYRKAPHILANIRRALAGETFTDTLEIEGGPGAGLVFENYYAPLRDHAGRVNGVIGIAT